jgi:hypothetical protein
MNLKLKAVVIFLLIFFALSYFMSMVNPYLPNTGNPTINYLESGGISAFLLLLIWEKWGRKEAGEAHTG